jgi:transposase
MRCLIMSEQERQLKALLEMVKNHTLNLKAVAEQMDLSYRQIKRIYKRYLRQGDEGLIHQNRGRLSNRRHPEQERILERYQSRYPDFGPTLAAEKLLIDGFKVDHETLRRWLIAKGLWSKHRRRLAHRQRRMRKAQFGELIQMDGSIHDWFENGELSCLMNMVDDATGKTLSRLEKGETTAGVFRLLWSWIERFGIPMALYVDLKTTYVALKEDHFSYVQKACDKLGIRIIKAHSPQAKGRVERNHGVYQDRFVKELRLQNIRTIQEANQLLASHFTDDLNRRFEKLPKNPQSAHRSAEGIDLNQIFCWEYFRQLQNDWTFSFEGCCYQVKTKVNLPRKAKLCIRRHLNGTLSAHYQDQTLNMEALTQRPPKTKPLALARPLKSTVHKPGEHHPWRQYTTLPTDKTPVDSGVAVTDHGSEKA